MLVHWFEQTESDVPSGANWLSASEVSRLNGMRIPKRRADWRLGRWTAKCAVAAWLKLGYGAEVLRGIEVRTCPSGAPEVFYEGEHVFAAVSLSHSSGVAMCAVAPGDVALGCDVERIEQRSDVFVSDFFTDEEQDMVIRTASPDRALIETLVWSAKESALKALGEGLRLDTRCVLVEFDHVKFSSSFDGKWSAQKNWYPLSARHEHGRVFSGWGQHVGQFVRTVVGSPAPAEPAKISFVELLCL